MSVYPDSHRIYVYLNDVRTNISDRVMDNITAGDWGMQDDKPGTRVGSTGWLAFTLNDHDGRFTPGAISSLSGWKKGIPCELEIIFEGNAYIYRFYISDIKPPSSVQDIKTSVKAMDWFDFAAEAPIQNPGVQLNQTGDGVLGSIIALMPIPPLNTDFDVGVNIFPTTLDTVTSKTKGYDEAVKVALSEIGYVYLHKDRVYGETLRFENARARNGLRPLSDVPVAKSESGFVLKAAVGAGGANHVLTSQGDRIILNQLQPLGVVEIMDVETDYGSDQINHMTMIANPRRIDTSPQILFQLNAPVVVGAGPILIRGTYADPAGGGAINGRDMIDPEITTDYLVNTAEDGSGVDISSDIEIRTNYYTDSFTHEVINYNVNTGYITKFNIRGYGIYRYNPVQYVGQDEASVARHSTYTYTIDQKYKDDLIEARIFADAEVERESVPRTKIKRISACANVSSLNMMAFLNGKIGDLFSVGFSRANISGYFYIHGMDDIVIGTGGMITFKWIIKEMLSLTSQSLTVMAVEFGGAGSVDGINFDYLPTVSDDSITQRTFSAWVYLDVDTGVQKAVIAPSADQGGLLFYASGRGINLYSNRFSISPGAWNCTGLLNVGAWNHVAVSYNHTLTTNDPIFYINGVQQTTAEIFTPAGVLQSEAGAQLVIGNAKTAAKDYTWPFDGKIYDARVYNRILSAAEISVIYNSGNRAGTEGLVTDGLVFQAFTVRTNELSDYVDIVLDDELKIIDNIYGAVGTPHGAPVGRSP